MALKNNHHGSHASFLFFRLELNRLQRLQRYEASVHYIWMLLQRRRVWVWFLPWNYIIKTEEESVLSSCDWGMRLHAGKYRILGNLRKEALGRLKLKQMKVQQKDGIFENTKRYKEWILAKGRDSCFALCNELSSIWRFLHYFCFFYSNWWKRKYSVIVDTNLCF